MKKLSILIILLVLFACEDKTNQTELETSYNHQVEEAENIKNMNIEKLQVRKIKIKQIVNHH